MTNEELLHVIASLPSEAKQKVEKYIEHLRSLGKPKVDSEVSFEENEFFGIWRDRDEMTDSTSWVRNTRKTHWNR